jgi:hypothetical protein
MRLYRILHPLILLSFPLALLQGDHHQDKTSYSSLPRITPLLFPAPPRGPDSYIISAFAPKLALVLFPQDHRAARARAPRFPRAVPDSSDVWSGHLALPVYSAPGEFEWAAEADPEEEGKKEKEEYGRICGQAKNARPAIRILSG